MAGLDRDFRVPFLAFAAAGRMALVAGRDWFLWEGCWTLCNTCWRNTETSARSQSLPIDAVLESGSGAVDRLLVEGFGDQHHADRQLIHQAARQAHCRMVRAVELRSVGQHLEAALQDIRDRR